MNALVFGSGGFIGRHVSETLRAAGHEVTDTYRQRGNREGFDVDLKDAVSVGEVLAKVRPDIVLNCAGVVRNDESAAANVDFTRTIITQLLERNIGIRRLFVSGSAAEYGVVGPDDLPVSEDAPLKGASPYAVSKVEEVRLALGYRESAGVPVVIGRIFNPIGAGMPEKQLVPRILSQIAELKRGERQALEIGRLDAERDYIDVRDLAAGIVVLATGSPREAVYNIGSGRKTSNGTLLRLLIAASGLPADTAIVQTMPEPEPLYACQAAISRINGEFGWQPHIPLEQTIKEVTDE